MNREAAPTYRHPGGAEPHRSGPHLGPGPGRGRREVERGYDLLEQGKFDQAQKVFEEVLRQDPGHPLALNNLAAIMVKQGNYDQALACLKRAMPRSRGFKVALNRVCNVDGVCPAAWAKTSSAPRTCKGWSKATS